MGVAVKFADSGALHRKETRLHISFSGRVDVLLACLMKMELFDIAGGKYGWLFSLELLLLVIANVPLAYGQQGSKYRYRWPTGKRSFR